jgi:3-hydroxybutyryl-CoA dehydrogenase
MDMKKIGTIGSGTMGSGIAQVCAMAGYMVTLVDMQQAQLDKALAGIENSLNRMAAKNRLKENVSDIMERLRVSTDLSDCAEAFLVMEAVYEDLSVKKEIFQELCSHVPEETILGTNTSAISITAIAACAKHSERVVGVHFFNPVPMLKAVEVIRGIETNDQTMKTTSQFVDSLGKKPIIVDKDIPGFLLNRINLPGNLEAMRLLEQGIGTVEDIDEGVKLAFGRPLGIFELGDLVGLDVTMAACDAIYSETKDAKYLPPVILRRMVKAGRLGKKTGKGWYEYNPDGTRKA